MPRRSVHRGRKIEVFLDTTVLPDGSEIHRDMITHPGAVVILPVLDDHRICLLKNYRFIVDDTLWELPAGTLEPDEPPEHAAARELLEETGYRAGSWRKLTSCFASPGCLNEIMHFYVATELVPGLARPEKDETLESHVIEWKQAMQWVFDGTIRDVKTIACLLMWDRIRVHQS